MSLLRNWYCSNKLTQSYVNNNVPPTSSYNIAVLCRLYSYVRDPFLCKSNNNNIIHTNLQEPLRLLVTIAIEL